MTLDETFETVVFDWDGTAVVDRHQDATHVRERVESLCAVGVDVFVVSGTHVENIDGQLRARPRGPGTLFLCLNRGSEVFEVGPAGPSLLQRRQATTAEEVALDAAAEFTIGELRSRSLEVQLVTQRLNRRKIDLIPEQQWVDPPKAEIAHLAHAVTARLRASGIASLAEVVEIAGESARKSGLSDPRITSDVKHVEIGLTDKSDSASFAASWLAERGITGGLVLIAGDEFGSIEGVPGSDSLMLVPRLSRSAVVSVGVEPERPPAGVLNLSGGPSRFLEVLDEQLERRRERRVPQIDHDPAWVLPLPAARFEERAVEALATLETLGNGWAGTRGSREEDVPASSVFAVGGVYTEDSATLMPGPLWTTLEVKDRGRRAPSGHRMLDLHTGTLLRVDEGRSGLRSMRFVSGASPFALALRAEAPRSRLRPGHALLRPSEAKHFEYERRGDVDLARSSDEGVGGIAVAARDWVGDTNDRRVVERIAAWVGNAAKTPSLDEAMEKFGEIDSVGFDRLLAEHREAWARRWKDAEVVIRGSPEDELAARFSLFHLLSTAADTEEAAVGARGLSGSAYGGHVFWDADVFVLPALAAIHLKAARAMLEYRIRRLPAARAAAKSRELDGARFPWESAADGTDVSPKWVRDRHGKIVPIRTGQHEEHIVADIAWAAKRYADWTGDRAFLAGPGRDLLVETARYWASRVRIDRDGRAHLYGVIGPDEYHEPVDDNAYTNVMARWNLREGAAVLAQAGETEEPARWRAIADALVDGWDPRRNVYEQFAGYFDLEPLLVEEVAPGRPIAIDVLLGPERVSGSQLIKQADVLMLHHLVPGEVVPGSLKACLDFYEKRTAHGSSLSPAIHASLLARAGDPQHALELFRIAARLDLDDLTGTTGGGLHLAAMGGTWQALAYGFLGLRADGDALSVDPCLPDEWEMLGLRFRFLGRSIDVRAEHDRVRIGCDKPLVIRLRGSFLRRCEPPGKTFVLEDHHGVRSGP
jgi:trehalose/maltose hydrolase-like predicted phosphorylase